MGQQIQVPAIPASASQASPVQIDMRPADPYPMYDSNPQLSSAAQVPSYAWVNQDRPTTQVGVPSDEPKSRDGAQPQTGAQSTPEDVMANRQQANPTAADSNEEPLKLADVVASVYTMFPQIQQSRLQADVTAGENLSAMGAYDLKLQGYSLSQPTGFYRNYQNGIGVARQLWWGGYVSAGYRIGRGSFQPWYKERETDEAGEYKIGVIQPLLQGRAIDPQRVAVFQANLRQQAVGPEVQQQVLMISYDAAFAYWSWVAAGGFLRAQQELLNLTIERENQLKELVKVGRQKAVDLVFNNQLVAERRIAVIESEQKFREAGFKLSLFLRDEQAQPLVPNDAWLPKNFPIIELLPPGDFMADLEASFRRRPEAQLLANEIQQVQWDLRLANNQLLPQLDLVTQASQDTGDPASASRDKGQFELEVGVQGEVPLPRRKARGKIIQTQAKIAQLQTKLELVRNKIGVDLQATRNALELAAQSVVESENALRASMETVRAYRFGFGQGSGDLVFINLLEAKVNEYEIKLVESQLKWFVALAQLQTAMGLDPIEQSIGLSQLPDAKTPQPGDFPEFRAFETEEKK